MPFKSKAQRRKFAEMMVKGEISPQERVRAFAGRTVIWLVVMGTACSPTPARSSSDTGASGAGIDSLNARLIEAYQLRDPQKYAALFTNSAVFEWPAFNTVRGRAGLEAMVRTNWASLSDQELRLDVASRRFAPDHATEFGAFQQTFRDAKGARMTEFGRYVSLVVRQENGTWLMDRFFGFSDSTRSAPTSPPVSR